MDNTEELDALTYEDLRDNYLFCRAVGHAWQEAKPKGLPELESGWYFVLKCSSCKTRRIDVIGNIIGANSGEMQRRKYDYPTGYRLSEKATRSQIREEIGKRRKYNFIEESRAKRKLKTDG